MADEKKPLKPDDFPVNAAVAEDIVERLNEDDARREEDKWSA